MLLAESSDLVQIVNSVLGLVGTIFAAYITYLMARMKVVTDQTHTLVNNKMNVQLKLSAVLARRLADVTKSPQDAMAAELAERIAADDTEAVNVKPK